ncbi:MAG: hypothetical protein OQK82_01805, partial [Candidatus Pacearchaeota archaeon]|nr:hypothetical protein [Candidatus Pacearchaeota archaeon]
INEDNENSRVAYNKYGIGVNSDSECGVQTLEELQEKWKGRKIDFGISKEVNSKDYNEPTSYMVQIADQWLEENPDVKLNYISFTDKASSWSLDDTRKEKYVEEEGHYEDGILIGERIIDPETNEIVFSQRKDRELFEDPLSILKHEYTHVVTKKIEKKDERSIKKFAIKSIREKTEIGLEALKFAKTGLDVNNLEDVTYDDFDIQLFVGASPRLLEEYRNKIEYLEKHPEEDDSKGGMTKLEVNKEQYERLFIGSKIGLVKDELFKKYYKEIRKENYDRLDADIDAILLTREEIIEEADKRVINHLLYDEEIGEILRERIYRTRVNRLANYKIISEYISKDSNKPLDKFYTEIAEEGKIFLLSNKNFVEKSDNILNELFRISDSLSPINNKYLAQQIEKYNEGEIDKVSLIVSLGPLLNLNEKLGEDYADLLDYVQDETGVPALYAYHKGSTSWDERYGIEHYRELPTTYIEEPLEERKQKLQDGSDAQKKVYTKLTQLAFDSGTISAAEYKELMGEGHCKEKNCCDRKCAEYKLNCVGACK